MYLSYSIYILIIVYTYIDYSIGILINLIAYVSWLLCSDQNKDDFGVVKRLRAAWVPGSSKGRIMLHPWRTAPCIVTRTPTIVVILYHPSTIVAVAVAVCNRFFFIVNIPLCTVITIL